VKISINKLNLVPDRIIASLVGIRMFTNGRGLGMGESYMPVVFVYPLLYRSPCFPDVDYAVHAGSPVDNPILFSRVNKMGVLQDGD